MNLDELLERVSVETDYDDPDSFTEYNDVLWDDDDRDFDDDDIESSLWDDDQDDESDDDLWPSDESDDYFDDSIEESDYPDPSADSYRYGYRAIADPSRDFTEEEIDNRVEQLLAGLSRSEEFNLGNALSDIGDGAKKVLQNETVSSVGRTVLPAAGAAIGTAYGGPIGTAVGGAVGGAASNALFAEPKKPKPKPKPASAPAATQAQHAASRPAPASPGPSPQPAAADLIPDGTQQAAQAAIRLINLMGDTNMKQALGSIALGSDGNFTVNIDGTDQTIPVASFVTMLSAYVNQLQPALAAAPVGEYDYDYLRNDDGEFVVDPSINEHRADLLYSLLRDAADNRY